MKLLLIHAKSMKYKPKKKVKIDLVEEIKEKTWTIQQNTLVAFISVEKKDESEGIKKVHNALNEIKITTTRVKTMNVILYPFAHLTKNLSSPQTALKLIKLLEKELRKLGFNVIRAPFGWYKEFILHCEGHPLSETFRIV